MDTTLRKALLYTITGIVSEKQRCPHGSGKAKDPRAGNNNHTRVLGKMGNTHIHRHTIRNPGGVEGTTPKGTDWQ